MGLLNKLLGGGNYFASAIENTQNEIFNFCGVTQPTDAQKLKAAFYLCISGVALINDAGGGSPGIRKSIDSLVDEAKELSQSYKMIRVSDLANNQSELDAIISGFPPGIEMTAGTRTNGLGAFEAMQFGMGETLLKEILGHTSGPMGATGYAGLVVGLGMFGKEKSEEHGIELGLEMMKFMERLAQAIKKS
jgi:hypothetical protein